MSSWSRTSRWLETIRSKLTAIAFLAAGATAALVTPVDARTLTLTMRDDVTSLSPTVFHDTATTGILSLVFEGLTTQGPDGTLAPALATSWSSPDGGRSWDFQLRPGVLFHNGRPLTAASVKGSLERLAAAQGSIAGQYIRKVEGAATLAAGPVTTLSGIAVTGPLSLRVTLADPDLLFPYYPTLVFEPDGDGFAGTGPFRVRSWTRGHGLELAAYPQHWAGPPVIDELLALVVPRPETLVALLRSGGVDVAAVPEDAVAAVARSAPDTRTVTVPRAQVRFLALNPRAYPPFADIRVRAAVAAALDRGAVARQLYAGHAALFDGALPPALGGAEETTAGPAPERARALLAEAGYPDGRGMPPLELTAIDALRLEAVAYTDQLRAVGFSATTRVLERGAWLRAAPQLPLFINGWTADFPDGLAILEALWRTGSRYNRTQFSDPEIDARLDRARVLGNEADRRELYRQIERRLLETTAMVPLPVPTHTLLIGPQGDGITISPFGRYRVDAKAAGP